MPNTGRLENSGDYKLRKYCSHECFCNDNRGSNHWYWRGGIKKRSDGYLRYSDSDKYVHRSVMEKHLGRKLDSNEVVHHIDGNTSNNDINNLKIFTNSEHRKLHVKSQKKDERGVFIK